jgi:purine-binding chemotaxis protein CheW
MTTGEPSSTMVLEAEQRMESIWRIRADRLSTRRVPEGSRQDSQPVMILGIGNERYGIDLADVAEVLSPVRVTPVPGAAAVFAGVINVHGEIRPVIDLRRLLGIAPVGNGDPVRVVLLRKNGREMGLQTDSVEQISLIGTGNLESAGNSNAEPSKYTPSKYVKRSTKDLLMLLSTEALFAELDQ